MREEGAGGRFDQVAGAGRVSARSGQRDIRCPGRVATIPGEGAASGWGFGHASALFFGSIPARPKRSRRAAGPPEPP
jgi:hypothetical protein